MLKKTQSSNKMTKRRYIKIKESRSYKNRNRNRTKLLYIHGFMSGANSYTVRRLIARYGHLYEILSPELNGDPHYSLSLINSIIAKEKPRLIVGSSLGGFYALMCESGDIPVVVVNPCVDPYTHLQRYLDQVLTYHSKRDDGSSTYTLTRPVLERFKEYDVAEKVRSKVDRIRALLSTNDEVLGDSHCQFFKQIAKKTDSKFLFKTDGRFGHQLAPNGFVLLSDMIDNVLEDLRGA